MDTKKYIYAPERDEHHRLFAVSLFNCSLMPSNEKQIGQRAMLLLIIGDAGWEFSGASHEIYSSHFGCAQFIWWAIARTRIFLT